MPQVTAEKARLAGCSARTVEPARLLLPHRDWATDVIQRRSDHLRHQ